VLVLGKAPTWQALLYVKSKHAPADGCAALHCTLGAGPSAPILVS